MGLADAVVGDGAGGREQITVNAVSPGWVPTERHANDPQSAKDTYAAMVPMKHMGVPADVAEDGGVPGFQLKGELHHGRQNIAVNGGNTLGY